MRLSRQLLGGRQMMLDFKSKWFMSGPLRSMLGAGLVSCAVLQSSPAVAESVWPMFDLAHQAGSPFPTDRFSVRDPSQNTGLRISLPKPDCTVRASDCKHIDLLNELDGFNLQPRLSVPFSGPIDLSTTDSRSIFLLSLGSALGPITPSQRVTQMNQIVWDVATNTLHVEPDELLEQHTRYALLVTKNLHDGNGKAVKPAKAFLQFVDDAITGSTGDPGLDTYRMLLRDTLTRLDAAGVIPRGQIVGASVFTTQSVTAVLEKIRDQIKAATPQGADFNLGPGRTRTVFPLTDVAAITFRAQTGAGSPPTFTNVPVPLGALRMIPGAVETIAFGKYASPDYQVHPGEFIPQIATRSGVPVVQQTNEIFFNLFLPSGDKPPGGWPVAMFGHGGSADKNGVLLRVAAKMAEHGIATIGINAPGHGFGELGTLTVRGTSGNSVTFLAGGRGVDQDGDGTITAGEGGLTARPPRDIIEARDAFLQTAVDLMQLVRVIELGTDVDGDTAPDLDASRIYYVGQSAGGNYGALLLAVEPSVRVGTLTVPGSPRIDNDRLSPLRRNRVGTDLASFIPPLLNTPGIAAFCMRPAEACIDASSGSVAVQPPFFDDNFPLRNGVPLTVRLADGTSRDIQTPVINTVSGAMEIQEYVERAEWIFQSGNSVAFAPYLRKAPLPGVPAKSVIVQFAKGDQTNPNPVTTAILRAGQLADRATLYRHDLAFAESPTLRKNPHVFMPSIDGADVAIRPIALGAQEQIAVFLASDGLTIIHPEPARFFEVPVALPLPEDLNFIP
jgi:virulence factor lipase-like protein